MPQSSALVWPNGLGQGCLRATHYDPNINNDDVNNDYDININNVINIDNKNQLTFKINSSNHNDSFIKES